MSKSLHKNPIINALRCLILRERERRNLTQVELARRSGLSRQYITLLEGGLRMPRLDSVFLLASGFEMSIVEFFEILMENLTEYGLEKPVNLAADYHAMAKWNSVEFALETARTKDGMRIGKPPP